MKKTLYLIVLTLCFLLALIGKSYGQGWEYNYTLYNTTDFRTIKTTPDGGVIHDFFVTRTGFDSEIYIERLDRFGKSVWLKKIKESDVTFGYYTGCGLMTDFINYNSNEFALILSPTGCYYNNNMLVYYKMNIDGDSLGHNLFEIKYLNKNKSASIYSSNTNKDFISTTLFIDDTATNRIKIKKYRYDSVFHFIDSSTISTNCFRTKKNTMYYANNDLFFLDNENTDFVYLFNTGFGLNGLSSRDTFSYLYKINQVTGNLVYEKKYTIKNVLKYMAGNINDRAITNSIFIHDKIYLFVTAPAIVPTPNCDFQNNCDSVSVLEIDKNSGNIIRSNPIENMTFETIVNQVPLNDSLILLYGNFYLLGDITYNKMVVNINNSTYYFPSPNKYGASYNKLDNFDFIVDLLKFNNSFFISFARDFFLTKTDKNGFSLPHILSGNVYSDNNANCIKNIAESGMQNLTIAATKNNDTYFGTSDRSGNYEIGISDTGSFTVRLRDNPTYNLWSSTFCGITRNLFIRDTIAYDTINFGLKQTILCAKNIVNLSSTVPFRIGRPNTYSVSYCNNGTIASPNTYITIKLDSLLDINSASIPYTTLPNHTYRFTIGILDFLSCGNFSFVATPRIGAVINGQTLCAEAHIYPDTICGTPNYTGAFIEASAQCLGDSVRFQLQNTGIGNMPAIKKYIVIEDNVLRINRNYQLNANQILTETIDADSGRTYRIIADQPDELPASYGDKFATAAIENCQPVQGIFHTGYFTQFPNYDGEPYRAMSCNVITGSYDPNEKVVSPAGYAAQHYIEANTQIDYQINFQNTGNDTAFKVVLVDTISPNLDINSIQLGVGSHKYQFQRTDSKVVQFVFDSINLVDSFRNERLSHGFVKFKIQQKANNPDGTKIYNKADIYFDYNTPITTNKTMHTIGRDFVQVNLISGIKNTQYHVKAVKVYPNPFREQTQIMIECDALKNPVLILQTLEGQIIKSIPSSSQNTFDVYREGLTNGMYIFKVVQNNEQIASGKLVIQ